MHVTLMAMFIAASSNSPTLPDDSLKIAIVTAISVVLAAAITGFATTFHKRGTPVDSSSQVFIAELMRRATVAEAHADSLENRNDQMVTRVDELERYCWTAGIDPGTGNPVRTKFGGPEGWEVHSDEPEPKTLE